jgi:hypothetical protein
MFLSNNTIRILQVSPSKASEIKTKLGEYVKLSEKQTTYEGKLNRNEAQVFFFCFYYLLVRFCMLIMPFIF